MKHACTRVILEEHASITTILQSLRMMLKRGPQDEAEIFFDVLRAMLFYIDEVPEKQHHPKETELLFLPLLKKSPQCAELIKRLENEHKMGEATVRELQHQLMAWEILGDSRRETFEQAAHAFIDFYSQHLLLEETVIIPEALKVLSDQDWRHLYAAFDKKTSTFHGQPTHNPIYDRLLTKIVMRAPEPIGLGRH
jgi:hemerythrin-like domain-containing protein